MMITRGPFKTAKLRQIKSINDDTSSHTKNNRFSNSEKTNSSDTLKIKLMAVFNDIAGSQDDQIIQFIQQH
jgi:hypothetical protein